MAGPATSAPNFGVPRICVDANTDARIGGTDILSKNWIQLQDRLYRFSTRRGRSNELQRFSAGSATAVFANRDRALDPTFLGTKLLGSSTRPNILFRIGASDPTEGNNEQYVLLNGSTGYISSTGAADLDLGGADVTEIRITVKVSAVDWSDGAQQSLFARWDGANTVLKLDISAGGFLILQWIDSASALKSATASVNLDSFATLTGKANNPLWIRSHLTFTGGTGSDIVFETSPDGTTWTQLGTTQNTTTAQGIDDSDVVDFSIGAWDNGTFPFDGYIYYGLLEVADPVSSTGNLEEILKAEPQNCSVLRKGDTSFQDTADDDVTWSLESGASEVGAPYDLFYGLIDRFSLNLPRGNYESTVTIQATDGFKVLSKRKLTETYSAELSSVRVTNVLDDVGWPTQLRNIATGDHSIIASDLTNVPALEHLFRVDFSEFGRLFIDRKGQVTFQSRTDVVDASAITPIATFDGTDYYAIGDLVLEDNNVWNSAVVSNEAGTDQNSTDATSILEYGQNDMLRTGLLLTTDGAALILADFLVAKYKNPGTRIPSLNFDGRRKPTNWQYILGFDMGQAFEIEVQPARTGNVYAQNSFIEAVNHTYDIQRSPGPFWDTSVQLSPILAEYAALDAQGPDQLDVDAILGP